MRKKISAIEQFNLLEVYKLAKFENPKLRLIQFCKDFGVSVRFFEAVRLKFPDAFVNRISTCRNNATNAPKEIGKVATSNGYLRITITGETLKVANFKENDTFKIQVEDGKITLIRN